jgi:hypothetical protein
MHTNPAWRYVAADEILRLLIKDGVPITVENYLGAAWRSPFPECLNEESENLLSELAEYEAYHRMHSRCLLSR